MKKSAGIKSTIYFKIIIYFRLADGYKRKGCVLAHPVLITRKKKIKN